LKTLICLLGKAGAAGAAGARGGSGGCTANTLPLIRMPARLRIKRWGVLMAASLKSDRGWTVALDATPLQQRAMDGQNRRLGGKRGRWMVNRPDKKKRGSDAPAKSAVVRHGQDKVSRQTGRAPRDESSKRAPGLHASATDGKACRQKKAEVGCLRKKHRGTAYSD